MANLPGQKTFLGIQQEISEFTLRASIADTNSIPSLTRLKAIVNDAVREICAERDWWFLFRNDKTLTTVVGQTTAYVVDDAAQEIRYMTIPASQFKLRYGSYEQWIVVFPGRYTNVGNSKPWAYIPAAPASNNALQFYLFPAADQIYTIEYGYKIRVSDMSATTDVPIIPPEFQDVLVNRAMMRTLQFQGDERWHEYDDAMPNTRAYARYSEMWQRNELLADSVSKFRDLEAELAFTASADLNRVLFVPF